ncbi:hypothetical protein J3F83DRAFT_759522 [Trichoderma novae-zelandiae]
MSAVMVGVGVGILLRSSSKENKPEEKKPLETISKKLEAHLRSKYKAPCTWDSPQCCCTEHDALHVPPQRSSKQFVATRHKPVELWLDWSTLCGEADTEKPRDDPRISVPPSSWPDSARPLLPMHWSVNDHLSFDKLASVRCKLGFPGKRACEVFFDKGTFEQKLQVVCQINRGSPEHYIACPHQSLSVSEPTFGKRNGWKGRREVQAWVTSRPPRCPSHAMERWSNLDGPYAHKTACRICHADVECTIEMADKHYMRVWYTCRRNLGEGLNPSDPKWVALMTGNGQTNTVINTQW